MLGIDSNKSMLIEKIHVRVEEIGIELPVIKEVNKYSTTVINIQSIAFLTLLFLANLL